MPFCEERPADGWPKDSDNDMDYFLLGGIDLICGVAVMASGIWSFYMVDRGLGHSKKPHRAQGPPEINSLSGICCVTCGAMYIAKAFDFFDGGGTPFSLNWYWYLDYAITCPMLILDLGFSLDLKHKLRHTMLVALTLWCGVASFVTPSRFRYGYFALGCSLFIPFSITFVLDVLDRYPYYPEKSQYWLRWSCWIFFSFWPLFPVLWIFSWRGTGHISQQSYFIIHVFLDLVCKTLYGVFMTYFRLELEEHTEVKGLLMPLESKNVKVVDANAVTNMLITEATGKAALLNQKIALSDYKPANDTALKLIYIQRLLDQALQGLGSPSSPSPGHQSLNNESEELSEVKIPRKSSKTSIRKTELTDNTNSAGAGLGQFREPAEESPSSSRRDTQSRPNSASPGSRKPSLRLDPAGDAKFKRIDGEQQFEEEPVPIQKARSRSSLAEDMPPPPQLQLPPPPRKSSLKRTNTSSTISAQSRGSFHSVSISSMEGTKKPSSDQLLLQDRKMKVVDSFMSQASVFDEEVSEMSEDQLNILNMDESRGNGPSSATKKPSFRQSAGSDHSASRSSIRTADKSPPRRTKTSENLQQFSPIQEAADDGSSNSKQSANADSEVTSRPSPSRSPSKSKIDRSSTAHSQAAESLKSGGSAFSTETQSNARPLRRSRTTESPQTLQVHITEETEAVGELSTDDEIQPAVPLRRPPSRSGLPTGNTTLSSRRPIDDDDATTTEEDTIVGPTTFPRKNPSPSRQPSLKSVKSAPREGLRPKD